MGTDDKRVIVFHALKEKQNATIHDVKWHKDRVMAIAKLGSDDIASGCNERLVIVWNWRTKTKIKQIKLASGIGFHAILKLDDQRIAVGMKNGEIAIL